MPGDGRRSVTRQGARRVGPSTDLPHVLREYALIADGERGILVGPRGDFAWMCFPRWDGDALFASLIGGAGTYTVVPEGRFVWGGYYEPGTLIWRSRWATEGGIVECREALALPGSGDRAVVLRRVTACAGEAHVRVTLALRPDFGRHTSTDVSRDSEGCWRARAGAAHALWLGASSARTRRDAGGAEMLTMSLSLPEGAHHDLVLVLDRRPPEEPPPADRLWVGTEAAWRERVPPLEPPVAQRDARHSYAVLSGLTSAGGGMVAAATTSLPERARQGRNYDYRYVWIRDQCYAGHAVARAGPYPLLDDAVRFVRDRILQDGPTLRPAYTVTGGNVPEEHRLRLPGYPGGGDVVGNAVSGQFQLDALGEALLLLAAAAGHDRLDTDGWRAVDTAAAAVEARWQDADAGIWELDPRHWTHSRLMCVAGLRAVAERRGGGEAGRWSALADAVLADAARHGVHGSGRWQRAYDDPRPDAALLLAAIRGAVPAQDPRSIATLRAVDAELTEDGYCYRFRPDERPLGRAEGAFLLCGFLMSMAWEQQGDGLRAARWFERNRTGCGPPGLFSEELDVEQRQLRGNLPQAFVHAVMLECALRQPETEPRQTHLEGAGQGG